MEDRPFQGMPLPQLMGKHFSALFVEIYGGSAILQATNRVACLTPFGINLQSDSCGTSPGFWYPPTASARCPKRCSRKSTSGRNGWLRPPALVMTSRRRKSRSMIGFGPETTPRQAVRISNSVIPSGVPESDRR